MPAVLLGTAILLLLAAPLVLHFAQKRHDRLPFDVGTEFPPDRPIVSGEVFAPSRHRPSAPATHA